MKTNHRLGLVAAFSVALTFSLSGCGGGSGDDKSSSSGSGATDQQARANAPAPSMTADEAPAIKPAPGANEKTKTPTLTPVADTGAAAKTPSKTPTKTPAETPATKPISRLDEASRTISPIAPVNVADNDIKIEPERLELGDIPTNDSKAGTVRLINTGTVARTLLSCKTSCGCTTANCQQGKSIEPGESVEVEIKLSGGQRSTKLTKTVTFLVSDQEPIRLPVSGRAVAFVKVEPARLDPDEHPEGRLTLTAIDDQPFTIKSMYPPIIDAFSTEPSVTHEINVSWQALKDAGHRSTKLLFTLDHPKCSRVNATLSSSAIPPPNRPTPKPPAQFSFDLEKQLRDGATDAVLAAIEKGEVKPGTVDGQGHTPLIKAARYGNPDVINALLDASADLSVRDRVGRTALMYACQSKKVEAVQSLLDAGANVQDRDDLGNTALCWASGFGSAETVREIVDAGADIEASGPLMGFTPLIWAALSGEADSIKILLEAGANVEAADVLQGATPVMHAVRTGGPDSVKALIEAGSNMEARDNEGKTALLTAASNAGADAAMVQLLLDAGADKSAVGANGRNALEYARDRTDLRAAEVVKLLESVMGASDGQ